MGFLDSLKDSVNSVINGKKEQGSGIQHEEAPGSKKSTKKPGLLSGLFGGNSSKKSGDSATPSKKPSQSQDDDDSLSMFDDSSDDDFDYNEIDDEIKGHRSDVLELLDIAEDYPVPSNVLLLGDLDRVRFDVSQPKGYDMHMVEEFYDSVHDSIAWYVDKLQQRNNDIRKMEDMLNKQNTDIHNAKVAEAMSDPDFTIMTGSESTAEQELQEAQIKIMNLEDENRKLQKKIQSMGNGGNGDQMDADTQSRYEALQNQLGIVQRENQKLKAQLKRQALEEVAALDRQQDEYTTADEYGDEDYQSMGLDVNDPSAGRGMPMPGSPSPSMPEPNKSNGIPTPGGMAVPAPGVNGGMPTPSMGGGMPTPGIAVPAPGGLPSPTPVNPFNGGGNGLKPVGPSIKELTNPSFESGRLGENSSKAMTMQSALDADDNYDLDPQVTSGSSHQTQDADFGGGFDDSFSFDYDGGSNENDDSGSGRNTKIPTSIDDGDYDEINLSDDDDDNEIISLDDGLFD